MHMNPTTIDFPDKLFVTGTDTGIGKTVVSAIITAGLRATYWKPIQSGLEEQTDTEFVREKTGLSDAHFLEEQYRLQTPMSPHASAAIDGVQIKLNEFALPDSSPLVVEGAGGLMVPLNDEYLIIDLIKKLDLSVILVARSELGTLNHTLLSLRQLNRYDIPCIGVVMNGDKHESNRKAIEYYGQTPVIGELEPMDEINPTTLVETFNQIF